MDTESTSRLLPWTNQELEALLKDLIAHGTEAAKADYKAELMLDTQDQKAEFLKDVSAIANTASDVYADHGFLIYGVSGKAITGVTTTERNTDKLQNTIEQLVKTYLSPMIQLYVIGFTEGAGEAWGTIVVTPNNNKPYRFVKDMQCQDPKRSRRRGEWFVRRGATTDPGLPEDLTVIMQRQLVVEHRSA
jgi:predicted HTH transcriptional regulator